jgi:hypothetical protein
VNYRPNPQNLLDDVAHELVTISTPTNTPEGTPPDEEPILIEDAEDSDDQISVPDLPQEEVNRIKRLLDSMQERVNGLVVNMSDDETESINSDLASEASDNGICKRQNKRQNTKTKSPYDDYVQPDYVPPPPANNINPDAYVASANNDVSYEADDESGIPDLAQNSPSPRDDESDAKQAGGKKTKHRKRKNNKNKTKKIKHTKKHTKKHIKKHKKHTKKH